MNPTIIFDFNRTLYDPDRRRLVNGAAELLTAAAQKGYRRVLFSQAVPSRADLINELGLTGYFDEIILTEHKTSDLFATIADKHQSDAKTSYVIGDRVNGELKLGYAAGWQTIWFRQGRFAAELPAAAGWPTYTVTRLADIHPLI